MNSGSQTVTPKTSIVSAQKITNVAGESEQSQAEINTQIALDITGFGRYNYKIIAACIFASITCQIGITNLGFILTSSACDFQMTTLDKGRLSTGYIFGMLCGSYGLGCLADIKGRRYVVMRCLFIAASVENIAVILPNYYLMLVLKYFVGFAHGGQIATIYTFLGEFQPASRRNQVLALMEIPIVVGSIVSPLLAWAIIPLELELNYFGFVFHSWNLFVIISIILTWIAGTWISSLPETPKYLSEYGMGQELSSVLCSIYEQNTGKTSKEFFDKLNEHGLSIPQLIKPVSNKADPGNRFIQFLKTFSQQTIILIHRPFYGRTFLVCSIMFCTYTSMYTLAIWFPELFKRFSIFENTHPNEAGSVCHVSQTITNEAINQNKTIEFQECENKISHQIFTSTLILGVSSIPSAILLPIFIKRLGFRWCLILGLLITSFATGGLFFVRSSTQNLILSAVFQAILSIAATAICCVIVELFPTQLRTTASALSSLCARSGALIGTTTFSYLIDDYCSILIIILTAELLVGSALAIFLPKKRDATPDVKLCVTNPQA